VLKFGGKKLVTSDDRGEALTTLGAPLLGKRIHEMLRICRNQQALGRLDDSSISVVDRVDHGMRVLIAEFSVVGWDSVQQEKQRHVSRFEGGPVNVRQERFEDCGAAIRPTSSEGSDALGTLAQLVEGRDNLVGSLPLNFAGKLSESSGCLVASTAGRPYDLGRSPSGKPAAKAGFGTAGAPRKTLDSTWAQMALRRTSRIVPSSSVTSSATLKPWAVSASCVACRA
jgi:hypothetical protein